MGIFPVEFPQQQQIVLKVSGFYIIWRLLRRRMPLLKRAYSPRRTQRTQKVNLGHFRAEMS